MAGRPDSGYEVRSRITARSDGRTRLLAVAAVGAVALWLAATLTADRRPPTTADATATPTSTAVDPTREPVRTVAPRPLPDVQRLPGAPTDLVPVVAGGLGWLAPDDGSFLAGPDSAWAQWPFLLADGTSVCLCLEPTLQRGGTVAHVLRFDAGGNLLADAEVAAWPAARIPGAIADVAIAPDARSLFVVAAIPAGNATDIRIDRVALDGTVLAGLALGDLTPVDPSQGGVQTLSTWVAPDGRHVVVVAGGGGRVLPDGGDSFIGWVIPVLDTSFGEPGGIQDIRGDEPGTECAAAGWVSATHFVDICRTIIDGAVQLTIRRSSVGVQDARTSRIVMPPEADAVRSSWLFDQSAGIAYGWEPSQHRAYRIDVSTLTVELRELPVPQPGPTIGPEAERPEPRSERARWSVGSIGTLGMSTDLVGSPDGTLLYALGPPDGIPLFPPAPTGIYVLEAATLRLVEHWDWTVAGRWLGLTSDGRYVLTVGTPLEHEVAAFGDDRPSLVIQSAADGSVVEIVRRIETRMPSLPGFLVPIP